MARKAEGKYMEKKLLKRLMLLQETNIASNFSTFVMHRKKNLKARSMLFVPLKKASKQTKTNAGRMESGRKCIKSDKNT